MPRVAMPRNSPKVDFVLQRDFLEVVDENFDTRVPSAGNGQPHAVDPPYRRVYGGGRHAQRLDPGFRLGQDEQDFFREKRSEFAIEKTDRNLPAVGAGRPDLQIGHGLLSMDMGMDRLRGGGEQRAR